MIEYAQNQCTCCCTLPYFPARFTDPFYSCSATLLVHIADTSSLVDDFQTTPLGTPVKIPVMDNDLVDADGVELTLHSIVSGPTSGSVVLNADGTVTYIPSTGFTGTDSFVYRVCDSQDQCVNATVTVLVESDNNVVIASEFAIRLIFILFSFV